MRIKRSLFLFVGAVVALAAGCNSPAVRRDQETQRFRAEMQKQVDQMRLEPAVPLTMDRCVELALQFSLDLRVKELALKLQDDQVRLALSQGLPKFSAEYDYLDRNNEPAVSLGAESFAFQAKRQEQFAINGMVPVLDFGLTYYSYQIALDRRRQERLLLERSKQLLARDVRIAYARYAGAIRQEKLAQIAYQAAQEVYRVAINLEKAKMTVRADTALIEAAVAQSALELQLATRNVDQSRIALSQLMSMPPTVPFTIIPDLPALPQPPNAQTVESYRERALAARPELFVQDLTQHIAANAVRREASAFFPHVDAVGGFNWSNAPFVLNPSYFAYGFRVTSSLLDGTAAIWRYDLAKKTVDVEKAQSLLLMLGILYDVELRAVQVRQSWETVRAADVYEEARKVALARTISLYREGLEDEATTAQALQNVTIQSTVLDRAQTEYLVAWYELEAAVLPAHRPTTRPTSRPSTQPALIPDWMMKAMIR